MDIILKSSSGYRLVPIETKLLSKRCIMIDADIDDEFANSVVLRFMALLLEDSKAPITIIINSNGGEVESGLLIYDVITSANVPVNTICMGKAFSMAAILFAAGSNRYILPNSRILLHEPLIQSQFSTATSSTIASVSKIMLNTKKKLNGIIAKHCRKKESEVDKITEHDHFFDSEEAVEFNLADKVVGLAEIMNLIGGENNAR